MASQVLHKGYMEKRQQFNTNEKEQEHRRKKFEPFDDLNSTEDTQPSENILTQIFKDKIEKVINNDDEEDDDQDEKQKDDDEDDDEENKKDLPSLDFRKMLNDDKKKKTQTLPFTNTQVEDVIFLRSRQEVIPNPEYNEKSKNK